MITKHTMAIFRHLVAFGLFLSVGAFRIYEAADLDNYDVGDACVSALSADIACNSYIRSFMQLSYRGSLENVTLTDEICTGTCSGSLRKWFDAVSKDCAGKSFGSSGTIATQYGGNIWAGWNETCVKDPKTKRYCNGRLSKGYKKGNDADHDYQTSLMSSPTSRRARICLAQSSATPAIFGVLP